MTKEKIKIDNRAYSYEFIRHLLQTDYMGCIVKNIKRVKLNMKSIHAYSLLKPYMENLVFVTYIHV
jgi:hypothetical protein